MESETVGGGGQRGGLLFRWWYEAERGLLWCETRRGWCHDSTSGRK